MTLPKQNPEPDSIHTGSGGALNEISIHTGSGGALNESSIHTGSGALEESIEKDDSTSGQ